MSAMSPYLSDCMPDERVAIQPPRRRVGEESGKCPMVQPLRVQLLLEVGAERAGLDAGETRLLVDVEHLASCGPCRARGRRALSSARGSRRPAMLLPPPNGMMTASAATAASTTCCTSASSAG